MTGAPSPNILDVKSCAINSGKGELGSVRTIDTGTAKVVEIVAARTSQSYTYAQPFTPIFYHGTLAVGPVDRGAIPGWSIP